MGRRAAAAVPGPPSSRRAPSAQRTPRVLLWCAQTDAHIAPPTHPPTHRPHTPNQALFDLEATNTELKADLRDLYITSAKEVDVANSNRKAIIVHVSV